MRRIDQRFVGELQQASEQAVVLGAGVAVLEVGAPGAADQQGVAGEHAVAQVHRQEVRTQGRQFVYMPTVSEDEVRRSMVGELVDRLFAGDPAALEVINGWRKGRNGKEIQERTGLTPNEFRAAARRVRRFTERLGDDADGG